MNISKNAALSGALYATLYLGASVALAENEQTLVEGKIRATISVTHSGDVRTYELTSNAELRDNRPADKRVSFSEVENHARVRTGNVLFDGLYALAISEALQNSVPEIKDGGYGKGEPIQLNAYQTGEFWTYVWTRDLSYSVDLALAGFDPERAVNSLLFKTSTPKSSVKGGPANQIIQDTGSGGSYPVSSDRIIWILGANKTLQFLPEPKRAAFLAKIYPILRDTLEQDRRLTYDSLDGLYRGEQSFLDWREQTYPGWTRDHVLAIAMSKTISVNAANYFALRTASEYARRLGLHEDENRYAKWAKDLKSTINHHFFDRKTGLYSTYLLVDGAKGIPVHRYDLLGECLPILFGVADDAIAKSVIAKYPTGPFGPPVVWPQEQSVPIYHNQAIWPFVTAYWVEAARVAGNTAALDQGIHSLVRGAAFNLSNMENFDFVTGAAEIKEGPLKGPVINSRRQLWSVAGYLGMVQDIVFGLETSLDGIRFNPCITSQLRDTTFGSTSVLELQNFNYCGKRINVRVHLPTPGLQVNGICSVQKVELNGKTIANKLIDAAALQDQNDWNIYLNAPAKRAETDRNQVTNISDQQSIFAPLQPQWENIGQGGITAENGRLTLHFHHNDPKVVFNIYRDGQIAASCIPELQWTDPQSVDYATTVHFYMIEAVNPRTGNSSHLAPAHFYCTEQNQWQIPAAKMENHGGKLFEGSYFMDWGKPDHEILVKEFTVPQSGHYLLESEFSNGCGPINTGIACGVKRVEIRKASSGELVAQGYLIMPQSGDWNRWDRSSSISATLTGGERYSIRLSEDEYSRNMSYLKQNERYTACVGGGEACYNYVNIKSFRLIKTK